MRAHWAIQANMVQEAHEYIWAALPRKHNTFKKPVEIIVAAYLKRPIDPDNVCDKLLIDGLKLAKVIKDDTSEYVNKASTQVFKSKKNYTIIEIYATKT